MCRGVDDVLAVRSLLEAGAVRPGGPQLIRRRPARRPQPVPDRSSPVSTAGTLSHDAVRYAENDPVGHGAAEPSGHEAAVVDVMGWAPMTFDDIAERSGLGIGAVAGALHSLQARHRVQSNNGLWERIR